MPRLSATALSAPDFAPAEFVPPHFENTTSQGVEDEVRRFYDRCVAGQIVALERAVEAPPSDPANDLAGPFSLARRAYQRRMHARLTDAFQGYRGRLLIPGCGTLPESHVALARQFDDVTGLDISASALEVAHTRLPRARLRHGSILAPALGPLWGEPSYDALFCAHVLSEIDYSVQERAVRSALSLLRPGGRAVFVCANPRSPLALIAALAARRRRGGVAERPALYDRSHGLRWWRRFGDVASVTRAPFEVLGPAGAAALAPSVREEARLFRTAAWLEDRAPSLALSLWQHPMIVLTKHPLRR